MSAARRRLKEVEARAHQAKQTQAKGKLGEALAAIEAVVSQGSTSSNDHGALSLLLHVYAKHPPKKASLSLEALRAIGAETEPREQLDRKKKALLKAQRDYHPDRNAAMVRATLDHTPEEWEVLCLTICQQLALTYDRLYKGERELLSSMSGGSSRFF